MDVTSVTKAVEGLAKGNRKFVESFDLLIALKELDLKNPDQQVEFFAQVPHLPGRKRKICALVGPEMIDDAKNVCDAVVSNQDFDKLDKRIVKKLATEHDYFLGQANIMPKIAQTFGRVLGPRGKMPNPKAGCVVPPKAPLKPLYERLQNTVKISVKKQPNIQVLIGKQDMSPEQVAQNVMTIYDQVIHHLPKERHNIKAVWIKTTMSKPVRLDRE